MWAVSYPFPWDSLKKEIRIQNEGTEIGNEMLRIVLALQHIDCEASWHMQLAQKRVKGLIFCLFQLDCATNCLSKTAYQLSYNFFHWYASWFEILCVAIHEA